MQGTGENIGAAAAAQKAANDAAQFLKNAAKVKSAVDTAKNGSGNNNEKNKPKADTADTYTYEHGKTHQSKKHNPNSPDGVGKPPRDAQDALDKSFTVKDSKERVAVQDGKIVSLKKTSDGLYHGYIIEDFFSIENTNVQHALVDNGLVRSMKSGKVIK